jgi:hypothetical protein
VEAVVLRYRGREIGPSEVAFVRELVAAHPQASRRALSAELSRAWGWVQPNGQLRDMLCRSLMLALARAGHIELPPVFGAGEKESGSAHEKWSTPPVVLARANCLAVHKKAASTMLARANGAVEVDEVGASRSWKKMFRQLFILESGL